MVSIEQAKLLVKEVFSSVPNEVVPGLWIGSKAAAGGAEEYGIKVTLRVGNAPVTEGCDYHSLVFLDRAEVDIRPFIPQAVEIISQAMESQRPILVHCDAGISRSCSLVIAYLMSRGLDYPTALATVRQARPIVQPNPGFEAQLT